MEIAREQIGTKRFISQHIRENRSWIVPAALAKPFHAENCHYLFPWDLDFWCWNINISICPRMFHQLCWSQVLHNLRAVHLSKLKRLLSQLLFLLKITLDIYLASACFKFITNNFYGLIMRFIKPKNMFSFSSAHSRKIDWTTNVGWPIP